MRERRLADKLRVHYPLHMRSDEQPGRQQLSAMRAISGEMRLQLAEQLYWSARRMKAAGLRSQHPEWSDKQIESEVTRIFQNARS